MRDGIEVAGKNLARHQAREMRHVHHEDGAHFVGHFAHGGEVERAWVGAVSGQQDERPDFLERRSKLVEADQSGLRLDAVVIAVEQVAGQVVAVTVRQVTP